QGGGGGQPEAAHRGDDHPDTARPATPPGEASPHQDRERRGQHGQGQPGGGDQRGDQTPADEQVLEGGRPGQPQRRAQARSERAQGGQGRGGEEQGAQAHLSGFPRVV